MNFAETDPTADEIGETRAAVSNSIVQLVRSRTGRGPASARTSINSHAVVVVLRDCLTKAEKTLVDQEQIHLVTQARAALHRSLARDATALVEKSCGRHVIAFLSDQQHDPDVAVLVFVFETDQPDPTEAGIG